MTGTLLNSFIRSTKKLPFDQIFKVSIPKPASCSAQSFHSTSLIKNRYWGNMNSEALLQKSLTNKFNNLNHGSNLHNDNYLRCTVFNKHGSLDHLSIDIKRKDLILKYKLMPRDIRKINYEPTLSTSLVPYISVRNDFILINLLHIRALIKSDSVLLFDRALGSYEKEQLFQELLIKLKTSQIPNELPYELKALEAILMFVTHSLNQEIKIHRSVTQSILNDLENHVHTENLRLLLDQNKKITGFYQKATLIRDIIDDLLSQDDLLTGMYLTTPRSGLQDHTEVEILLETYYKHFDEAVQIVEEITNNIKTTQEIINIILDSNRNQLMLLGLRFSIGILFLGCGIYVASVYGMNLENFMEEENYGFGFVIGVTTLLAIILFWRSINKLHKLERIAISGSKSMPIHSHQHFHPRC